MFDLFAVTFVFQCVQDSPMKFFFDLPSQSTSIGDVDIVDENLGEYSESQQHKSSRDILKTKLLFLSINDGEQKQ